jgi:phosphatidylserine decarboxylase
MTFAKEAWPFVLPFVAFAAFALWLGHPRWGVALLVVGFLVLLFFRDPARRFDGPPSILVAPADGKVTQVSLVEDSEIGPGRFHRIVTFLSVFDVHVQRCPTAGKIVHSELRRGLKLAAFRPDVGEKNEAWTNVFERAGGDRIGVRQLAGLLARRVVSYRRAGDALQRGNLLGVIKFGSRVDLFVPESYRVLVASGQRVRNGETPMAEAPSPAGAH